MVQMHHKYQCVGCFVFSANADREEVLNTFNKTTLRLPHEIWFLQNDDLSEDLEYKIFML